MIYGLDLFSGIGGLTLALQEWVRPVAYCENDKYAQSVLLSRMSENKLPVAPIWDDIQSLHGSDLQRVDIIYGGFPCQDISVAGHGKGLEGERSGLFFEIMRLVSEIRPRFIFLENVPAILVRGHGRVIEAMAKERYDVRWLCLSASEVGAPHKRDRWFCLANANSTRKLQQKGMLEHKRRRTSNVCKNVSDSMCKRPQGLQCAFGESAIHTAACCSCWWKTEPEVGRVANGISKRVDRIKCLGNAVVPMQAKTAFQRLMWGK